MTHTVKVYKQGIELGEGTATADSASITSYTGVNERVTHVGRNVQIVPTTGSNIGATWRARVLTDASTLVVSTPDPFSD